MTVEQCGNQPEIIQPYPRIQLTDDRRSWLAEINSSLASGVKIPIADMKGLLQLRHGLNITDSRRALLREELGKHYGFSPLQPSNDVQEPFRYDDDIAVAIDLENYMIDPRQALAEYQTVNWNQELEPYKNPVRGLATPPFRFSQFVAEIKSAIVYKAIDKRRARLNAEADRILAMSPDEWNEYRAGIRYAQEPYAEELRSNGLNHYDNLERVTRTHMWGPSSKEQWKGLHERFGQFDTYKVMKDRANLILDDPEGLLLENVIIPRLTHLNSRFL